MRTPPAGADASPDASPDVGTGTGTVAVVGGGISGLSAAWHLHTYRPDLRVVVLEAGDHWGGSLRVEDVGGVAVDVGAEAMLARRPEAVDLVRELGLADRLVSPAVTRPFVWGPAGLVPLPAGTVMGVPAHADAVVDVVSSAAMDRLRTGLERTGPPVDDDVDVATWLSGRIGPAVVDALVEPLLGGVYAGRADRLSVRSTLPQLWPVAVSGAPLGPALRALTPAAGASGTQLPDASAPAPAAPVFAGIEGGVGSLPVAIVDALTRAGAQLRSRTTVTGLRRTPAGWDLEFATTGPADPGGRSGRIAADAVVLAVPTTAAVRLLTPHLDAGALAGVCGIRRASVAVLTYLVDTSGGGEGAAAAARWFTGSGYLVPPSHHRFAKAATFSSSKWAWTARAAGPGRRVVRLSVGRVDEDRVLQRGDDELLDDGLAELTRAVGHPGRRIAARVTRWGGALPQYDVGHHAVVGDLRRAVDAVAGLAVCGAWLDGVGIPACVAAARRAAAEVAADLPPDPATS